MSIIKKSIRNNRVALEVKFTDGTINISSNASGRDRVAGSFPAGRFEPATRQMFLKAFMKAMECGAAESPTNMIERIESKVRSASTLSEALTALAK